VDKLGNMNNEIYWRAVAANDARFDGAFYLGVKTTGIYCKPSCRARLPKRENVEFYDSAEMAENSGFRACLRCRPRQINGTDPQVARVLKVCRMMERDDSMSLERMATELDLSPFHLQRSFKAIVGVSPKKYSEAMRMEKFKSELRNGSDVVTATYEAGFGSGSRLYEKASEHLGMTPATYKKGGKGMKINYVVVECELGLMLVGRTSRGICSVTFGDSEATLAEGLTDEFPKAEISLDDKDLQAGITAIIKYISGKVRTLVLPLDLQATSFQLQVWEFLRKIPYGETRSYTQVAEAMGDKKKVRAVAQACARNRVAIIVPCHRVVASDGGLSGYRWGVERKKELLTREKLNRIK
jgi:AraC family transcriptional regulator, regulatory protein of adaptative response / methylated-DNA-[protein]-cysteine methyltransferase